LVPRGANRTILRGGHERRFLRPYGVPWLRGPQRIHSGSLRRGRDLRDLAEFGRDASGRDAGRRGTALAADVTSPGRGAARYARPVRACPDDPEEPLTDHVAPRPRKHPPDRKSTRLNSSHVSISYAVFC